MQLLLRLNDVRYTWLLLLIYLQVWRHYRKDGTSITTETESFHLLTVVKTQNIWWYLT